MEVRLTQTHTHQPRSPLIGCRVWRTPRNQRPAGQWRKAVWLYFVFLRSQVFWSLGGGFFLLSEKFLAAFLTGEDTIVYLTLCSNYGQSMTWWHFKGPLFKVQQHLMVRDTTQSPPNMWIFSLCKYKWHYCIKNNTAFHIFAPLSSQDDTYFAFLSFELTVYLSSGLDLSGRTNSPSVMRIIKATIKSSVYLSVNLSDC